MQDPIIRHSYVQVNHSLVHLMQYGFHENILRSPTLTSSKQSTNSSTSYSTKSYQNFNSTSSSKNVSSDETTNNSSILNTTTSTNTTKSSIFSSDKENLNVPNNSIGNRSKTSITSNNTTSSSIDQVEKLIILIPGNPGILGVYDDFLLALFRTLSNGLNTKTLNNYPVILAIGHNNFDHPDNVQYQAEERICVHENDLNFVEKAIAEKYINEPHHIELQILNKLIILKRMLKININNCKLIFIGHSIGCYVILKLLQDKSFISCHKGSILIHPALENLASTKGGVVINRIFNYKIDMIAYSLAFVLEKLLPQRIKLALAKLNYWQDYTQSPSSVALESVAQLISRKSLTALIQMAKSELAFVKNINTETMIKPHCSKLKLIYAIEDKWVNLENRKMLRELYPDLYMEEQPSLHAFILVQQTVMDYATKIGLFIRDFLDNTCE